MDWMSKGYFLESLNHYQILQHTVTISHKYMDEGLWLEGSAAQLQIYFVTLLLIHMIFSRPFKNGAS